jgi:hypothetical protein
VYTVLENVEVSPQGRPVQEEENANESRAVFLLGATTALLVVLHDNEASKSLLLGLEPELLPRLVSMLDRGSAGDGAPASSNEKGFLAEIVLHFLARWVDGAPLVLQALLQHPEASTVIAQLRSSSEQKGGKALVWLLLGMSLDQIMSSRSGGGDATEGSTRDDSGGAPRDVTHHEDWGGWTASAIVDTFKSRGISRVINDLKQFERSMPWLENSQAEQRLHQQWYKDVVLRIRKRLIQSVLQQNANDSDVASSEVEDESGSGAWSSLRSSSRSLSILVDQQMSELEELRTQLSAAKRTLSKQGA